MAGFRTFAANEILTSSNVQNYLMNQTVMPFVSAAARDAAITAPIEGMVARLNDVNKLTVYSGAAWSSIGPVDGALTTWTPTVTQNGAVTVTNNYSTYIRIGRLIIAWFYMSVTGTGSASNAIVVAGIPATAATGGLIVGTGELFDSSAALKYPFNIYMASTTTLDFRNMTTQATDNRMGITGFNAALTSPDTLVGFFAVEAAADA